jgi:fructose-specific component phosphotransferase system IIB-like protein
MLRTALSAKAYLAACVLTAACGKAAISIAES